MGSDLSDRNIYDEARNRIHARNGEAEEISEEVVHCSSISISWCYVTFYTPRLCMVW